MTHQVALSGDAYTALRKARKSHESFSDAVLRLLQESKVGKKDPTALSRAKLRMTMSVEEHLALIDKERREWT